MPRGVEQGKLARGKAKPELRAQLPNLSQHAAFPDAGRTFQGNDYSRIILDPAE
ncbi:hypothetical protein GCM10009565_05340 [Amycolatopsis albidoflavus]